MMRLSTMWKVDRTVADDGSSPVAERILERWDYDSGSVRFFRSSANFLYVFQCQGRHHFLRFSDSTERTRASVDAEVDLVTWLAGAGIAVALPVPSTLGNRVETVSTDWGEFHATVLPAKEGEQLEIEALDRSGFRRWGAALGTLHTAMMGYQGEEVRSSWNDHLDAARRQVPQDTKAVRDELAEITALLRKLPVTPENYGLIHFDFELDNLVWRGDSAAVLDFDDCSRMWFVADIAFALGDLLEERANLNDDRFLGFVDGYVAQRPLDEESLARLPLFLRLQNFLKYARMVNAVDLEAGPEHPDWLHALHRRLHQRMDDYRASITA